MLVREELETFKGGIFEIEKNFQLSVSDGDAIQQQMNLKAFVYVLVLLFVCANGDFDIHGSVEVYNPCCSMPCHHRGVCIPVSGVLYECHCPEGYYGENCEKATFFRWLIDKLSFDQIRKQKFASTGKLIWGVINNIPFLHNAALRYVYFSGSDVKGFDSHIWHYDRYYANIDVYRNQTSFNRGLPPVPQGCPTPLGIKGPQTLPDIREIFELLFRRRDFKPCPLGTNLMFATFAQHLSYQFFKAVSSDATGAEALRGFGVDDPSSSALRSRVNGKLKARIINGEEYPPYLEDVPEVVMYYPLKDMKGRTVFPKWAMSHKMLSITPLMFALATVWLREHNRVCDILVKEHPDWKDERIYRTARWIVLGELLTITGGEYFQHLAQFRLKLGYKPQLLQNNPVSASSQMHHEFSLTFQWHHMMPDVLSIHGKLYNMSDLMFSNNRIVFEHGLDAIVDSMSRNLAGKITHRNCGGAFETTMKQLIEEGRKTRLHSFNDYRRFYGLKPYESFLELAGDEEIAEILEDLYGDVDAVEFVIGIFMENHPKSVIPPTMLFLGGPVALRKILTNPIGSSALWRPSTFGGKAGFDIVQKASLRKLFCLNLKGNCKNNVWVSFKAPWEVTNESLKRDSSLNR